MLARKLGDETKWKDCGARQNSNLKIFGITELNMYLVEMNVCSSQP